ncbi:MAG TPA: 3-isopropylmalate dehydratase small subunit [Polyangiaceae bacterium]|jgi:3-isopropylmalate/(R)-2-methylmalate dehydratase small subunit|nr:3-isopropylmalate dehydratase small subunit [Polyangiaceae bacterium]
MASFTKITSHAVVIPAENIDTDQIIPARFLKVIDKNGLGKSLFCDWRYLPDGTDNPDFPLNYPASQGAQILIAGDNFGCGSSREHAPWALVGWGIRVVISTSFADIFKGNSLKNGLLPVVVSADVHQKLLAVERADPKAQISVDLTNTTLTLPDGSTTKFPIDAFAQHCLLNGIDQLGYILGFDEKIKAYESVHPLVS